jgi:hypothetical protein
MRPVPPDLDLTEAARNDFELVLSENSTCLPELLAACRRLAAGHRLSCGR